jgi:hypothetical protein
VFTNNWFFWGILILLLICGGIFFSIVLLDVFNIDYEIIRYIGFQKLFHFIAVSAPYFWLMLFIVAFTLGIFVFRKTKKGYRYNIILISSVFVLLIGAIGFMLHSYKINQNFEHGMSVYMPNFARTFAPSRESRWGVPHDGILPGQVISFENELLILMDPKKSRWDVSVQKNTRIHGKVELITGEKILVIGKISGSHAFEAFFIKPLPKRDNRDFPPMTKKIR